MYKKARVEDDIRVDPRLLGRDVETSIFDSLKQQYEGNISKQLGVVLKVLDIDEMGEGEIKPEDAGVYYPVSYEVLSYEPELHEVIEGEVTDVTEFGAFIRIGPIEGLCHISQIMNDYVNYDEKQDMLVGDDGNRTLQSGDKVRARITAVSLKEESDNKVNLTMRQPTLGKLEWIEEEIEEEIREYLKELGYDG